MVVSCARRRWFLSFILEHKIINLNFSHIEIAEPTRHESQRLDEKFTQFALIFISFRARLNLKFVLAVPFTTSKVDQGKLNLDSASDAGS